MNFRKLQDKNQQGEQGFTATREERSGAQDCDLHPIASLLDKSGTCSRFVRTQSGKTGFTLIEILFYIFLLVIVFTVIVQMLVTITGTFQRVNRTTTINQSAIFGIERIVREIRNADDIVEANSTFAASSSTVALTTLDENGDSIERTFSVNGGALRLAEDGVDQGPITPDDVTVTAFGATHITSATTSEAVRLEITAAPDRHSDESVTFYSTAVARGTYNN